MQALETGFCILFVFNLCVQCGRFRQFFELMREQETLVNLKITRTGPHVRSHYRAIISHYDRSSITATKLQLWPNLIITAVDATRSRVESRSETAAKVRTCWNSSKQHEISMGKFIGSRKSRLEVLVASRKSFPSASFPTVFRLSSMGLHFT